MLQTSEYSSKLMPHQLAAKEIIKSHPACGLFMDMGTGKTFTTLTAIYELREPGSVLVIAPLNIARSVWIDEIKKWGFPFRYKSLVINEKGSKLTKKKRLEIYDQVLTEKPAIYFVNPELIKDMVDYYSNKGVVWPFPTIVIDEMQRFKSPKSVRFEALKRILPYTRRRIGLTGTPAPNGLLDLWAQMFILDFGKRLGTSFTRYRDTFFYSNTIVNNIPVNFKPRQGAENVIYNLIDDITVSVKNTVIALPPLSMREFKVYMSPQETKLYNKMKSDHVLEFTDGEVTAKNAGALAMRLSQLASGAIYVKSEQPNANGTIDVSQTTTFVHTAKVDAAISVVENTSTPVLIGYHFKSDLEMLLKGFKTAKIEAVKFDGTAEMVHAWNDKKIRVMLIQPASAGHGLNLQQGGHTLIWFSLPQSLEEYQQANARLYRKGQTEPVQIYHLITDDTIDSKIWKMLQNKAMTQDELLEAVKLELP